MSAAKTFGSPIIVPVDGEDVSFPRLLSPDYGTLETQVRVNNKAKLRQQLDECKIIGADRFMAIRGAETLEIDPGDVSNYAITYDGARRALGISLAKSGKTTEQAGVVIGKLSHPFASRLARVLLDFLPEDRLYLDKSEPPAEGNIEANKEPAEASPQ